MSVSFDLVHGDSAFKPVDWRLKVTPTFNVNFLDVEELGVVSPDETKGHRRGRTWFALEEWFAETKLADLIAAGMPVLVKWSDGNLYPARCTQVAPGQVCVMFGDGRQLWVPEAAVSRQA